VPVFSLRSQKSYGVGDFADLVPFADWAKSVGISLIQLLPIHDTTSTNTFVDSYPYKGITVFGLHPVFLNLDELTEHLTSDEKAELEKERAKLNDLPKVDYVSAMQLKKKYSYLAYERSRESLLESDEFQAFCAENEDWLVDYSVFCYLRDEYETADFRKWEDFAEYDSEKVKTLLASSVSATKEIEYYQFVQFYLNKQLHYAVDYCHKIKLALKGDLPIGISRDSVDAWVAPSLYNMSFQTGAPPDPFSQTGQNWGFPTYNWQEMQKDDYKWWRRRLSVMSRYFDALRIDHILGFFRIWEIPLSSVRGLLGHFSPAMPLSLEELRVRGVRLDIEKFTKPFINDEILQRLFGDSADKVKDAFLTPVAVTGAGAPTPAAPAAPAAPAGEVSGALYEFKEQFNTQVKIKEFIDKNPEYYADATEEYTDKLYTLLENVLFLKDKDEKDHYHPRIFLADSMAAEYIGDIQKNILLGIHDDFFFVRHNEYWAEQALIKLPTVRFATNMLICGEDLGMIPDSVPEVLKKINLLRLIVQRMSPIPSEAFVPLKTASYNAVCTPGTHDMSVLREWWHENRDLTQKFYNDYLNLSGPAPYDCEPPIVEKILKDHFDSPAMLAIIQLQDLLDSYGGTRFEGSPSEERINVPAIMPYYWQYRMHLYIEDLQNQGELNEKLTRLITEANRKL
jgi:4-alpha-glucanotransferase